MPERMSRITEEMVKRAWCVFENHYGTKQDALRAALEAVADELGAQYEAELDAKHAKLVEVADKLRALRALGPQPAQGGEWTLEDAARLARASWESDSCAPLLAALNELFPRAKPVAQGEWTQGEAAQLFSQVDRIQRKEPATTKFKALVRVLNELHPRAKPVAQGLTAEERDTVEAARRMRPRTSTLAWFLLEIIDNHFPKPEPAVDPVLVLCEEMRCADPSGGNGELGRWADRIALAQKAGKW